MVAAGGGDSRGEEGHIERIWPRGWATDLMGWTRRTGIVTTAPDLQLQTEDNIITGGTMADNG